MPFSSQSACSVSKNTKMHLRNLCKTQKCRKVH
nr:MAG TPA: hypothetical protein [Caudoviricetes sp.]